MIIMLTLMIQLITLATIIACVIQTLIFVIAMIDFQFPLCMPVETGLYLLPHLILCAFPIRMLRLLKPKSTLLLESICTTTRIHHHWSIDYNVSIIGNATDMYILLPMSTPDNIQISDVNAMCCSTRATV